MSVSELIKYWGLDIFKGLKEEEVLTKTREGASRVRGTILLCKVSSFFRKDKNYS